MPRVPAVPDDEIQVGRASPTPGLRPEYSNVGAGGRIPGGLAGLGGGVQNTTGTDWSKYAPLLAGGIAGLGPLASLLGGQQRYQSQVNPYLPFTQEGVHGIDSLSALISELQRQPAPQRLMNQAGLASRQAAIARGLTGPLAAALEQRAAQTAGNLHEQQRLGTLQALLGQRAGLVSQMQQAEELRRQQQFEQAQKAAAEQRGLYGGVGSALGAVGGGLLGSFLMPGLGTAGGAAIGGQLGNLLGGGAYDLFGGPQRAY